MFKDPGAFCVLCKPAIIMSHLSYVTNSTDVMLAFSKPT